MALLNFKNKRTSEVFEFFHGYFFHYIENLAKKIVNEKISYPYKLTIKNEDYILIDNTEVLFEVVRKKLFAGIKVNGNTKEQSYNAIIFNTLIHYDKKYTIMPYIFNELEGGETLIVNYDYFSFFYNEMVEHLTNKKEVKFLEELKDFFNDLKEDDVVYCYYDKDAFYIEEGDIKISELLSKEVFFEKLKEDMEKYENSSIKSYFESSMEEWCEEISENMSKERKTEIIESKMVLVTEEILSKYYFENNYNVISVLPCLK